jgi:hypothetical protein
MCKYLDENALRQIFLGGPAGEMGADDLNDEWVEPLEEVMPGLLVALAVFRKTSAQVEYLVSHRFVCAHIHHIKQ